MRSHYHKNRAASRKRKLSGFLCLLVSSRVFLGKLAYFPSTPFSSMD